MPLEPEVQSDPLLDIREECIEESGIELCEVQLKFDGVVMRKSSTPSQYQLSDALTQGCLPNPWLPFKVILKDSKICILSITPHPRNRRRRCTWWRVFLTLMIVSEPVQSFNQPFSNSLVDSSLPKSSLKSYSFSKDATPGKKSWVGHATRIQSVTIVDVLFRNGDTNLRGRLIIV